MQFDKKTLTKIFLGVVGCILLYWLLHETERVKTVLRFIKGIVSPFALGAALAFILNVPMRAIEKLVTRITNQTVRRMVALLLTFLGVLLVLALVFWLLIPQVISTIQTFIPRLYTFFTNVEKVFKDILSNNPQIMEWVDVDKLNLADIVQKAVSMISSSISTILAGTFSAIGSITGALMDVVIAVVFSIYCLFQKETLARQGRKLLYAFLPEKFSDGVIRVLRLTNVTFSNFLSGQCVEVCILGSMFAIAMAIFRMPYIPLVSVLVAVTAFIPVVGAWVGCVFGAFLILIANPIQAVWFVIMFLILQQIENNLIYPRVVGTSIGLSGMWVLVAVAVGGEVMGAAGMFLMIPVASVIAALLQEVTNRRLSQREVDPEKLMPQPPELVRKRIIGRKKEKKDASSEKKD